MKSSLVINEIIKKYNNIEIERLLAHVLGKPKEFIFMEPDYKLSSYQVSSLSSLVDRRSKGEPMAYILGYKDFDGLRFKVNKHVLIPRPETEWLVEHVVQAHGLLRAFQQAALLRQGFGGQEGLHYGQEVLRILDLGTGSGCIIVSLAKKLATNHLALNTQFYASDISAKALSVAKQNAKTHKAKIKFAQSGLFQNISGKFDIIIANLPYVPLKMLHRFLLHKTNLKKDDPFAGLKYEPSFALTDGTSTWQIYKKFMQEVRAHVNPGAVILLETDPASKKFLMEYQKKYLPNGRIKFYKDFNNLIRYAEIKF